MRKSAVYYLDKARQHMEQRAAFRDTPEGERSMDKCVAAFNLFTGNNLSETDGWLFMQLLKLSRASQGSYHEDDYEDDVAYAALKAEAAYRENTLAKMKSIDDFGSEEDI